jgi:hypothetical protein
MKTILSLSVFLLSFCIAVAQSGSKPFIIGETVQISSVQLSEMRTLNIYLPDGYKESGAKYPVIYLLDGSANEDFVHIAGIVQFLTMIQKMPGTIVVGIANVDRQRDFTYPTTIAEDLKSWPTTGKSAKFIDFMEKELQPYIEKNYRVSDKTIIGQSLGGLLATEILLKKPSLFNNYIIVSPSMWWDNGSILNDAPQLMKDNNYGGIKVYLSVGSEGKQSDIDTNKLSALFTNAGSTTFYNPMPEETHLTILHNSAYKGLELLNKQ